MRRLFAASRLTLFGAALVATALFAVPGAVASNPDTLVTVGSSTALTYQVGDRQYVAIASGSTVLAFGLP